MNSSTILRKIITTNPNIVPTAARPLASVVAAVRTSACPIRHVSYARPIKSLAAERKEYFLLSNTKHTKDRGFHSLPIHYLTIFAVCSLFSDREDHKDKASKSSITLKAEFISLIGEATATPCQLFDDEVSTLSMQRKKKRLLDKALEVNFFNQMIFAQNVIDIEPEFKNSPEGHCAGHTYLWYQYYLHNKNYVKELDIILDNIELEKPLNAQQSNLLQLICKTQKENTEIHVSYVNLFGDKIPLHKNRICAINIGVNFAKENPGKLIILLPGEINGSGHMIGVVAEENGAVKYFDPNIGERTFINGHDAQVSLSKLIAYKYSDLSSLSVMYKSNDIECELSKTRTTTAIKKR